MDDVALVAALRSGDEQAFALLVDRYYATMLRVARMYVATAEAAEDAVQEAFLGLMHGIDRFEARSSLRTWLFRILVNRAKTKGEREGRTRPFSSLVSAEVDADDPAVDPERFLANGAWQAPPAEHQLPEVQVLAREVSDRVASAIDTLPPAQRAVISLRDVKGLSAPEVCEVLDLSEGNQRVLLHRARSKVRALLEDYLEERGVG